MHLHYHHQHPQFQYCHARNENKGNIIHQELANPCLVFERTLHHHCHPSYDPDTGASSAGTKSVIFIILITFVIIVILIIIIIITVMMQVPVLPVPQVSPMWDEERGRAGGEAEGEQVIIFMMRIFINLIIHYHDDDNCKELKQTKLIQ